MGCLRLIYELEENHRPEKSPLRVVGKEVTREGKVELSWWMMDPVTHYSMSPYVGMDNNPISLRDPWGSNTRGCNWCSNNDPAGDTSGDNGQLGSSMPGFDPYADPNGFSNKTPYIPLDPAYVNFYKTYSWGEYNRIMGWYNSNQQRAAEFAAQSEWLNQQSIAQAAQYDPFLQAERQGVLFDDYMITAGFAFSAAEEVGNRWLSSGRYKQSNGAIGNFNDRSFKKLSRVGKANKTLANSLVRAGKNS